MKRNARLASHEGGAAAIFVGELRQWIAANGPSSSTSSDTAQAASFTPT